MSKNRIAAALSLSGVLLAGTAAALVNSQVLSSNNSEASAAVPAVTVAAATIVPTSGTVPAADSVPSPTQASYQVGDAGWVVLDTIDGGLTVVATTPNDGWLVVASVQEDPLQVRVEFQSYTTLVTFRANALFGVVATSVETTAVGAGSVPGSGVPGVPGSVNSTPGTANTTPGSGSTNTTIDDDDDDDKKDDDDKPDDD